MDKKKLSLKKANDRKTTITEGNTESDSELANEHMEMSQKMKEEGGTEHTYKIVPINFNFDGIDGELNQENEVITEYCGRIEKLLEKRNYVANLLKDLRKYEGENLPVYARINGATFAPRFGSEEASNFFKEKLDIFNKTMKETLRMNMLNSAKELFDRFTMDMQTTWEEATAKIDVKKEGGHNTLRKFNERVMALQEKWTQKYRESSTNNESSELSKLKKELRELKEKEASTSRRQDKEASTSRRHDKDTTDIGGIKRELEQLKEMIGENGQRTYDRRDYRGGRGGRRGRRFEF